ncbi:MAG: TM0106 family RecB-like putative nuclease [Micrococcales bacterium]
MRKDDSGRIAFDTRDLMRVSSCSDCTTISILRTLGHAPTLAMLAPYELEPQPKTLAQKYGEDYEEQLTLELRASVADGALREPEVEEFASMAARADATIRLMKEGVPLIYQGALISDSLTTVFRGKPDFLVRADWQLAFVDGKLTAAPSPGAEASDKYTAWDAKYGSKPKPAYALQVGLYVAALDRIGFKADHASHGIILGNRTLEPLTEAEVVPAMGLARAELELVVAEAVKRSASGTLDSMLEGFNWYCSAAKFCDICEYPELCAASRESALHLSLVYGIRSNQIEQLESCGITRIDELAASGTEQKPERMTPAIWEKLVRQAKIQWESRTSGQPQHLVLPGAKIEVLPPPSDGDIFFDMEGFQYFRERGGLEYLFGNWTRDSGFVAFWAHSRDAEKVAFENFIDWATQRLRANPSAHIYHYAAYERTALRKLATRHSTREAEVSWLEGNDKLVDLLDFVSKSIVVGEESYSIKKLERHYGFKRRSSVTNAADSMEGYEEWLLLDRAAQDPEASAEDRAAASEAAALQLRALSDYNEDDVKSTLALYEWLAAMPGAGSRFGSSKYNLDSDSEEGLNDRQLKLAQLEARTASLIRVHDEWLEANPHEEGGAASQTWQALTHSVLFYAREAAKDFTDLMIRMQAEDSALSEDSKATALSGVVETGRRIGRPSGGVSKLKVSFEATVDEDGTYDVKEEVNGYLRSADPTNSRFYCPATMKQVSGGLVEIVATLPLDTDNWQPDAFFNYANIGAGAKETSIEGVVRDITSKWVSPGFEPPTGFVALDLLFRRAPRLANGQSLHHDGSEHTLGNIIEALEAMEGTVLAVQGPPGSGKTYLGSHAIAHLLSLGYRIGVASTSHAAVENLLSACITDAGVDPAVIHKKNKSDDTTARDWNTSTGTAKYPSLLASGRAFVLGGTAWTFSSDKLPDQCLDYIFVDEAAQFSMVDAVAISRAAKNLVLLGDPLQLPQVVNAIHPGGVENSALGHYMGQDQIIPDSKGFFVDVTRRLHPRVNQAVSWLAYDGRLQSHPITENNLVPGVEPGIHVHPLDHSGNGTQSPEEVKYVAGLVRSHLGQLDQSEILVISPYNAQVDAIRRALDSADLTEVRVGTVDKFQGQEAMVVVYSLAASSADDAPRGVEFILNRNRMNVGISRAKAVCHFVFSKHLLRAQFRNLEELKAMSRLIGVLEFAN